MWRVVRGISSGKSLVQSPHHPTITNPRIWHVKIFPHFASPHFSTQPTFVSIPFTLSEPPDLPFTTSSRPSRRKHLKEHTRARCLHHDGVSIFSPIPQPQDRREEPVTNTAPTDDEEDEESSSNDSPPPQTVAAAGRRKFDDEEDDEDVRSTTPHALRLSKPSDSSTLPPPLSLSPAPLTPLTHRSSTPGTRPTTPKPSAPKPKPPKKPNSAPKP